MNRLIFEIKKAALEAPRIYFAPLVGAIRAIRLELERLQHNH